MVKTLMLNKLETPVSIVPVRRALSLVGCNRAVVRAVYENTMIRSSGSMGYMDDGIMTKSKNGIVSMLAPSVIQCTDSDYIPHKYTDVLPLTRQNLYIRDHGHCFLPGTLILMADGSLRNIENVKKSDKIIDAYGQEQVVEYVHKEKISEEIIEIKHRGNGLPIRVTKNHNSIIFTTNKYDRKIKKMPQKINKLACEISGIDYLGEPDLSKKWKFDNITRLDIKRFVGNLKYPVHCLIGGFIKYYCGSPVKRTIDINFDFGKFIGLFLAEGGIDGPRVRFTLHIKETYYSDFLRDFCKSTFGLDVTYKRLPQKKTLIVELNSRIVTELIKKLCYNKGLKSIANKKMSKEYLQGVLIGLFYGDGHLRNNIYKVAIGFKEGLLIKDTYLISNILRIYPSLSKESTNKNDGRQSRYVLYQAHQFNEFIKLIDSTYPIKDIQEYKSILKTSDRIFIKDYILGKVSNIIKAPYVGYVYNLQVSGSHTYIANFVATNNCQYCGKKVSLSGFSFEHYIAKSLGGKVRWDNILVACTRCNSEKGNKPIGKFKEPIRLPYAPRLDKAAPTQMVSRLAAEIPHKTWIDWIYWHVVLRD